METLKLSEYELSQLQAINNWKNEKPSVLERTVGVIFKPVEWLTEQIIPKKAIEGVITTFNALAKFLTDTDDIKRDACVESIDELRTKDLQLSDKLANEVHNWANAVAVAEGTGTDIMGFAGLIVDVPSLITMGFRVIHKIGVCYGYDCDTEYEKTICNDNYVYCKFQHDERKGGICCYTSSNSSFNTENCMERNGKTRSKRCGRHSSEITC